GGARPDDVGDDRLEPARDLPGRGPYRRGRVEPAEPGALGSPGRGGRAGADAVLRDPAGEPRRAGLWRAVPEGGHRGPERGEPPRHRPPHHAADRPGRLSLRAAGTVGGARSWAPLRVSWRFSAAALPCHDAEAQAPAGALSWVYTERVGLVPCDG